MPDMGDELVPDDVPVPVVKIAGWIDASPQWLAEWTRHHDVDIGLQPSLEVGEQRGDGDDADLDD